MIPPDDPSPAQRPSAPEPGHHPRGPRTSAVALSYRDQDSAPRVVAKGYGVLAETILRTAREHGLYVHESPELVGLLMQVDLDSQIPPQLYQAVAELLAWLYQLEALVAQERVEVAAGTTDNGLADSQPTPRDPA